jgi:serralysin
MLNGGMGNDAYVGGAGADAFMVMPDSGHDVVLDFEARGEAQGAFDHVALMDIMPSQVHVNDTTNGALVWWDTDGDDMADGSILLKGVAVADLRQSDFMFNAEPAFVAGVSDVGSWYVFPG